MAQPYSLIGLMQGLAAMAGETPACLAPAMGMALWGLQFHPFAPNMAACATQFSNAGLVLAPDLGRLAVRLLHTRRPG